jgi:hypothetical protein
MESHEVERDMKAACNNKDRKALGRLILAGWREGGREVYRSRWKIRIMAAITFTLAFGLNILGGETLAWAGCIFFVTMMSLIMSPPRGRCALDEERGLQLLFDRMESNDGRQRGSEESCPLCKEDR